MKLPSANARFAMPAFLTVVLVVSALTILLFPLFTVFYQYPEYARLLRQFTENEATAVARYLSSLLVAENELLEPGSLDPDVVRRIQRVERDAHFLKVRIYSPSGMVVYSSVEGEVGFVNQDAYFREMLEARRTVAVEIGRDDPSLEGRYTRSDVVEVYVPIIRQNRLAAIFEMYYNVSRETQRLRRVLNISAAVQFSMAAILLIAVLVSVTRATGYLADRQRVLEELRTLSLSDELTGLYNRRGFFVLAEQQIKIARRSQRRLLLVSADVDGLKAINDGFGHHEGDRALADAAQILRVTFRESDIIGRIGGDEFLVLITDRPDVGPDTLARRLQDNVVRHNSKVGRPYPFSISAGIIAIDPQEAASLNDLLVRADQAMYADKRSRRGSA
jgi:diguanylate cyclase (GGDEF)-like protein